MPSKKKLVVPAPQKSETPKTPGQALKEEADKIALQINGLNDAFHEKMRAAGVLIHQEKENSRVDAAFKKIKAGALYAIVIVDNDGDVTGMCSQNREIDGRQLNAILAGLVVQQHNIATLALQQFRG